MLGGHCHFIAQSPCSNVWYQQLAHVVHRVLVGYDDWFLQIGEVIDERVAEKGESCLPLYKMTTQHFQFS